MLRPNRTVTPSIVTLIALVQIGLSAKTLSIPFVLLLPAWMMVEAEPAPLIVSEPVTSRSPVESASSFVPPTFARVSWYVPAGSVIVLAPPARSSP